MKQPAKQYGRASLMDKTLGLDEITAPKVASIIVHAGNIEHHLERAIWILEKIEPKGIRPKTDLKPITNLISMLEKYAETVPEDDVRTFLQTWSKATRSGFIIRHNIAHGVSFKMEKSLVFSRNPRWHGELRKREFGDLWCEPYVLDLIRESFATLLRIIAAIATTDRSLGDIASPLAQSAVREARSILGEFADQFYNPSFEKY
ncbi:hypothetical protein JDO7802_02751 [Jannaschia donghaensis]|uniref:Uncharacterized protein n=2 Tax=Jannaschia donghaensis TaxID=420998 RepID=A0A0M6YLF7_9RHOB|nr:hypothetical protein JDO7802_02751 [Jannaschia donghaensis]